VRADIAANASVIKIFMFLPLIRSQELHLAQLKTDRKSCMV
jgi:hypothetical protein